MCEKVVMAEKRKLEFDSLSGVSEAESADNHCSAAAGTGIRIIGADEMRQLWPLEISYTVCEEDSG